MESNKETQPARFKYFIEFLSLIALLSICSGLILGIINGWGYLLEGFLFALPGFIMRSINISIPFVVALILLNILLFFVFNRFKKINRTFHFAANGLFFLPLFMYFGYQINKYYLPDFFEFRSIMLNLLLGIAFILIWFLVSKIIFSWISQRILMSSGVNYRRAGIFVGIIFIFNIFPFLLSSLQEADNPNVIIILIDALRADHLSSYGYERHTTSYLDDFSKDGVVFTQAISQGTFTKASVASLFTSLYPFRHGVYFGNRKVNDEIIVADILDKDQTTLAEVLSEAGFLTAGWVENPHLKNQMGFAQGFVEYHSMPGKIKTINRDFLEWVDETGKYHKFFAYLHYLDLHDPYSPKPPYDTLYGKYSDFYSNIDFHEWGAFISDVRNHKIALRDEDVEQLRAYYDGLLTYIDDQIRILFDKLKRAGLYDNTLIIVTADHGDGFMEHGFISHSTTPYDELLKVPLIIKFPNSQYKGRRLDNLVRLIDVMPTILGYFNIHVDLEMQGINLLHYLKSETDQGIRKRIPKYAYTEVSQDSAYPCISIRTTDYKYIHFENRQDELYNLRVDPGERNNIVDSEPKRAEEYQQIAFRIISERKDIIGNKENLDEKTIEQLKSLGYIR